MVPINAHRRREPRPCQEGKVHHVRKTARIEIAAVGVSEFVSAHVDYYCRVAVAVNQPRKAGYIYCVRRYNVAITGINAG